MFPMVIVMVGLIILAVMLFSSRSGNPKEKKKRAPVLLWRPSKRATRSRPSAGSIGTISEVRDNEIVLKVDESTNTRIRYMRSAIQGVIEDKTRITPKPAEVPLE